MGSLDKGDEFFEREEDVYERIVRAAEKCSDEIVKNIEAIIRDADLVTEYGKEKALGTIFYSFDVDIPRNLFPNEDWNLHHKRGTLKKTYLKLMDMAKEGMEYDCDVAWGYEGLLADGEPPKNRAEELAKRLVEPYVRTKREFLESFGESLRKSENKKCKLAVEEAILSFNVCMMKELEDLIY